MRLAKEGEREKLQHEGSNIFNLEIWRGLKRAGQLWSRVRETGGEGGKGSRMGDSVPERGSSEKTGIGNWNRKLE